MKPRISVITVGVDDLERALRFYRDGLGPATEGIIGREFEHGAVVFIELQAGLRLALCRASLAHDSGLPLGKPCPTEFMLAHNVSSKEEVAAVMAQAKSAGAVIVKTAQETFGAVTRVISRIPTATCGRSHGTRSGPCRTRHERRCQRAGLTKIVKLLGAWDGKS